MDLASGGALGLLVLVAAGVLSLVGAMHLAARRGSGFFHYVPYGVLLSLAVFVFVSARSFVADPQTQSDMLAQGDPMWRWIVPVTSLLVVLVSVERIASCTLRRNRPGIASYLLVATFAVFWFSSVASPALFSSQGSFSHDYLYTLAMGCAAVLLSQRESDAVVAAARTALMGFLAISVALIPLRPTLVLDFNYAEGLLPGVPRLAGLAAHSVSLGMLAELALLCLYARPFRRSWLNRVSWPLGLFALVLAQSKSSWISFPVCLGCMSWVRGDFRSWLRFSRRRQNFAALAIPLVITLVIVGIGLAYIAGDLGFTIDSFVGQNEASFTSLTGRDRIWAVALEDWARHPILGYGTNLFDEAYRGAVQMPYANDAHNQFIDTLARSGLVGAAGLVLYVTVLLALSLKYARGSGGLSVAVFLAVIIRSVSQVPLGLFHYGPDALQHFLLLAILAGRIGSASLAPERYPVRQRSNQNHNTPRSDGRPEVVGAVADNRRRRLTLQPTASKRN